MRPLFFHRVLCLLALLGVAATPLSAMAQTLEGLTLSVEAYQFEYDESAATFGIESDDFIFGARAGYTFRYDRAWYLQVHGRYAQGDAVITTTGAAAPTQTFYEGGIEWGRDLGFEGTTSVAPFVGLSYRLWDDPSLNVLGFDRSVSYLYMPLGFTAYFPLGSGWTISTRLEVDLLLYGEETDTYDLGGGATQELEYKLNGGWGYGAELLLRKRIGSRFAMSFGPYFRNWDIDTSDTDQFGVTVVPSNSILEAGLIFKINM